jgi:predicted RNase H-like HicB family nuclease
MFAIVGSWTAASVMIMLFIQRARDQEELAQWRAADDRELRLLSEQLRRDDVERVRADAAKLEIDLAVSARLESAVKLIEDTAAQDAQRDQEIAQAIAAASKPDSDGIGDTELEFNIDREDDGRWLCEVGSVRGATAYGKSPYEAIAKAFEIAASVVEQAEAAYGKEVN